MSYRPTAAAAAAGAALAIAATGVAPASAATVSPRAKLATANQTALVATHAAVVTVAGPASSHASLELYAGRHVISHSRKIEFRHAGTTRVALPLTGAGIKRLRACHAQKLVVRVALRHGKRVVGPWSWPDVNKPATITEAGGQPGRRTPGRTWSELAQAGSTNVTYA